MTTCDLTNGSFDCKATVVVGPSGRVFYVSPDSVYVWATPWNFQKKRTNALLFRMPLDGSGPTALRVSGFALLGYELVEGRMDDGRINELRRINHAPL